MDRSASPSQPAAEQPSAEPAEILLTIPAQNCGRTLADCGVAAIAERQEMPQDDLDEMRRVIDNALAMLISHRADADARIDMRFLVAPGRLQAEMVRNDKAKTPTEAIAQFTESAVSTGVSIEVEPESGRLYLGKQF